MTKRSSRSFTLTLKIFSLLLGLLCYVDSYATHNRAGEITYEQIDDLTITITITTYTKTSSAAADRDSLMIFWGDGTSEMVSRSNGGGLPLPNDVKLNKYIATHTYPGRATYTIFFNDPNRVGDILNVNPPNSIDIRFFLSTTFTFLDPQFQGFNSSAQLLQPPLDFGCVGKPFVHNPNAYDVDGDSLAYELITPLEDEGMEVPNYFRVDEIGPGPNNQISLDPLTGTFTWDSPAIPGEYNIAFLIKEYRQGILINSIIRDMQILIRTCENDPPEIEALEEYCVVAGEQLKIDFTVDDPNAGQRVEIGVTGGPFEIENPMIFDAPEGFNEVPVNGSLIWNTDCNHIFNEYYQVVIRAVDNYFGDSTGLATLKTIRIKVMGPPPEIRSGESLGDRLRIEWALPYSCEDARDGYFQGFSIWRKEGSQQVPEDTCFTGLEGQGYKKVNFLTTENDGSNYFWEDRDVVPDKVYCYRILAEFALFTATGNPFNRVESIPSEEICLLLKRDLPFMTETSVISTDQNNGLIRLAWEKPVASDLDTVLNPGPYRYQVEKLVENVWQEEQEGNFSTPFFNSTIDTFFLDRNINTQDSKHSYRIAFYSNNLLYGYSEPSTSIYLNLTGSDRQLTLSWNDETPWSNFLFNIMRENADGSFSKIGDSRNTSFIDDELENNQEYCYIIESEGTYGVSGIRSPLINFSQKACDTPTDVVPPCPPVLSIENDCEDESSISTAEDLGNLIIWEIDNSCTSIDDVNNFNVYYRLGTDNYTLIHTSSRNSINEFFHQPDSGLSGCYVVTNTDSLGNESQFSNEICIDNCPSYVLPNTFTPNDDGSNDRFVPRVNRFIASIDLKVFNQWGNKVFESIEPEINWSGNDLSGQPLTEGVYYYICLVFERDFNDELVQVKKLKGHINLLR